MPDDQTVVFLDREVAEEVLDLVDDKPGHADEDLLDEAAAAISSADKGLPPAAQQAVARGDGVAVGLRPEEVDTLRTLIETDTETDPGALRSIARSLQGKLRAARKKARRG